MYWGVMRQGDSWWRVRRGGDFASGNLRPMAAKGTGAAFGYFFFLSGFSFTVLT